MADGTPRRATRGLGLLGDILASGALVAGSAIVNLATVLAFARILDPIAFGLFATCRRLVAFVAPLASAGCHLGTSRYLGFHSGDSERRTAVLQVGVAATGLVVFTTLIAFAVLFAIGHRVDWIAELELGVWYATGALAATTAAGLLVFSILRGLRRPRAANLHQLSALTALLAIGLVWRDAGVTRLLAAAAVSSAVINGVFLLWAIARYREVWRRPVWSQFRAASREITGYSILRIGDGPLQASLSFIGIVAAPAIGGLTLAGYIHISQTLVRVSEIAVVPLSVTFLPIVARHVRDGRLGELHKPAQLVYDSVFILGACSVAHGLAWGQVLLNAAFGSRYADAVPFLLCSLPSILPFLVFVAFRSFIDGYSVKPINTIHLTIAVAFILVATRIAGPWFDGLGICVAYSIGVTGLGLMTVRFARRHFGLRAANRSAVVAVGLAISGGAIAVAVSHLLQGASSAVTIGMVAAVECGILALTGWTALRLGHPVATFAVQRFRDRKRPAAAPISRPGQSLAAPVVSAPPESEYVTAGPANGTSSSRP